MERPHSPSYQFFMLVLCVYALTVLAVQTIAHVSPDTRAILDYADYAVCVIFLIDFLVSLAHAPNRRRYFFTWGWLDLLSSIPMLEVARWGRVTRVVRIFRILRGLRATRLLASLVLKRRSHSAFLAAALVALLLVVFCSIAVLNFETVPEANIKTPEDAIWWAVATITTVGYGDRFPVTSEGRFVAAILMCAGVGLLGTLSAFLAAWFLGPQNQERDSAVAAEVRALREEIGHLRQALTRSTEIPPFERRPDLMPGPE